MNGPSGAVGKMLNQNARDVGLSPNCFQFFSVHNLQMLREINKNELITSSGSHDVLFGLKC